MKLVILLLVSILASFAACTAWANNPNKCRWWPNSYERMEFRVAVPSSIVLKRAEIGQVMASVSQTVSSANMVASCPLTVPKLSYRHDLAPGSALQLEAGYTNVYKTGINGVGLRFKWKYVMEEHVLPGGFEANNPQSQQLFMPAMKELSYEFVRTGLEVGSGEVRLDFIIRFLFTGWHAANINVSGVVRVETGNYFNGCAGIKKDISVLMGKASAEELRANEARTVAFDLSVSCSGLPARSALPLKVYFEGDSPGPGRLNLRGGGGSGVEISLLNDQSVALPFSQGSAMAMNWIRSGVGVEIYHLPIRARYVQKNNATIEAGRADAELNYILEYN